MSHDRPKIWQVGYIGSVELMSVTVIHIWRRYDHEIQRGPITGSSGPKALTINLAIQVFSDPEVGAIAYVVGRGVPMFIIRRGNRYFIIDREIEIRTGGAGL